MRRCTGGRAPVTPGGRRPRPRIRRTARIVPDMARLVRGLLVRLRLFRRSSRSWPFWRNPEVLLRPPLLREVVDQGLVIPDGDDGQVALLLTELPDERFRLSITDAPGQHPALAIARALSPVHGGKFLLARQGMLGDDLDEPMEGSNTRRVEGEIRLRTVDQLREVRWALGEEAGQDPDDIPVGLSGIVCVLEVGQTPRRANLEDVSGPSPLASGGHLTAPCSRWIPRARG
jgi:hypothetical protein